MKIQALLLALPFLLFISCEKETNNTSLSETASSYYKAYAERTDFENFLSFYDNSIVLEDMTNGDRIEGKVAFSEFFDWKNPDYIKLDSAALYIKEQIIDKNKVVTTGYFTAFKWGELEIEAMQFTSILTFNSSGKIIKQVDWINYPSYLVDYNNRKNSNKWIIADH
jgi:hypothetical protein